MQVNKTLLFCLHRPCPFPLLANCSEDAFCFFIFQAQRRKMKNVPRWRGCRGGETLNYIFYVSDMDPGKFSNNYYNKRLQPYANSLRKQMTKAETCLWKYVLRAGLMKGYSFRRQRPVLNFIADFMCKELMLIIEVDGITHTWEETVKKDEHKEAELRKAGFTVLRFPDHDVLNDIENVKRSIYNWIEDVEAATG
jgi:very-short-patch-repair endonuclease